MKNTKLYNILFEQEVVTGEDDPWYDPADATGLPPAEEPLDDEQMSAYLDSLVVKESISIHEDINLSKEIVIEDETEEETIVVGNSGDEL